MTLADARTDLYELVAKNTDLDPATTAGAIKLDRYLNRAYREVASWKLPRGGRLAFPSTRATKLWQNQVYTGTATAGTSTTITIPTTGLQTTDGYYEEWVISLTSGTGSGQTRTVVSWTGSTGVAEVFPAWGTTPDATSVFLLTKAFVVIGSAADAGAADEIVLEPATSFQGILRISDVETKAALEAAESRDNMLAGLESPGTPTEFALDGLRIYFNVPFSAERWWKVEYVKAPAEVTTSTAVFALPPEWMGAVLLRAKYWVLHGYGEMEDVNQTRLEFLNLIGSLAQAGEDVAEKTATGTGRA